MNIKIIHSNEEKFLLLPFLFILLIAFSSYQVYALTRSDCNMECRDAKEPFCPSDDATQTICKCVNSQRVLDNVESECKECSGADGSATIVLKDEGTDCLMPIPGFCLKGTC